MFKMAITSDTLYPRIGVWRLLGPQEVIDRKAESADTSDSVGRREYVNVRRNNIATEFEVLILYKELKACP
ncbi:hypothetical protein YWY31_31620 [Paenibacillus illinoisensis]